MQLEDIMKFLEEIKKFQNNGNFYTVSENATQIGRASCRERV